MIPKLLKLAAHLANSKDPADRRTHKHGAVGVRSDGAHVYSRNGSVKTCTHFRKYDYRGAHAESRLVRKLDSGSVVYVARVSRTGQLGLSAPCSTCRAAMRARGVKRCIYSISDEDYGVVEFD